jgi:hypothetical protein
MGITSSDPAPGGSFVAAQGSGDITICQTTNQKNCVDFSIQSAPGTMKHLSISDNSTLDFVAPDLCPTSIWGSQPTVSDVNSATSVSNGAGPSPYMVLSADNVPQTSFATFSNTQTIYVGVETATC